MQRKRFLYQPFFLSFFISFFFSPLFFYFLCSSLPIFSFFPFTCRFERLSERRLRSSLSPVVFLSSQLSSVDVVFFFFSFVYSIFCLFSPSFAFLLVSLSFYIFIYIFIFVFSICNCQLQDTHTHTCPPPHIGRYSQNLHKSNQADLSSRLLPSGDMGLVFIGKVHGFPRVIICRVSYSVFRGHCYISLIITVVKLLFVCALHKGRTYWQDKKEDNYEGS